MEDEEEDEEWGEKITRPEKHKFASVKGEKRGQRRARFKRSHAKVSRALRRIRQQLKNEEMAG